MCDRAGAIYDGRDRAHEPATSRKWLRSPTRTRKPASWPTYLVGADVFIGVSAPELVTTEMVKTMNKDAIVFACANPTPEIFPDEAKAGGARVVGTGRSDYPNQINNVLAFPGDLPRRV